MGYLTPTELARTVRGLLPEAQSRSISAGDFVAEPSTMGDSSGSYLIAPPDAPQEDSCRRRQIPSELQSEHEI